MNTFETYLNESPSIFFKWKIESNWPVLYVSDNVKQILGYSQEDFLTQSLNYNDIIHPDDKEEVIKEVNDGLSSSKEMFKHNPYRLIKKDGSSIWVSDITRITKDKDGNIDFIYGYISDITELIDYEHKLEKNLIELEKQAFNINQYQIALDESYIISMADPDGKIIHVNDNFIKISGYTKEELIGKNHNILRNPLMKDELFADLWQTITAKKIWRGTIANLTKSKKTYYINVTIVPILENNGDIKKFLSIRYDTSSLIEQQEKIKQISHTSRLTETKNFTAFQEVLRTLENGSLALININRFNNINNLYGYEVGDKVILKLSQSLKNAIKNTSLDLYHIHVDEFAILNNNMTFEDFLRKMIEIQEFLNSNPITIDDKSMPLHVTVAMSQEKPDILLTTCSMAMHQAKESRLKFKLYHFDSEIKIEYENNIKWMMRVQEAILNDLVTPFFQPIFCTKTNKIEKYEALIRIKNKKDFSSPAFFLDIAKKSNLYTDLSLKMIEKVFQAVKNSNKNFSFNITYEDIENDAIREYCYKELNNPEIANRIVIEIVESEKLQDTKLASEFIKTIKSFGAKISIDDFGSGYSNFDYLLRLDADFIKIDGSLIKDIDKNIDSEDIVRTIVSFAKRKNIKVVAEFVSSEAIYNKIKELDIDYVQGYYLGMPNITLDILKPI